MDQPFNKDRAFNVLRAKIEWMGKLYEASENAPEYEWTRVEVRHRCGGNIWVFVEMTGVGYYCDRCEDAEVL